MSILLLSASAKKEGNCMQVCKSLQESLVGADLHSLNSYNIRPCIDCGFCKNNLNSCSLDLDDDDCAKLFSLCHKATKIVIVSPIYFYHAPAKLKAFIDRTQMFWHVETQKNLKKKELYAIYVAARPKGEKLSLGLDLTLKYFAPMLNYEFKESLCLYGLENPTDFSSPTSHALPFAQEAKKKIAYITQVLKSE